MVSTKNLNGTSCLHLNNSLNLLKMVKASDFFLKKINPCLSAKIINKRYKLSFSSFGYWVYRSTNIRVNQLCLFSLHTCSYGNLSRDCFLMTESSQISAGISKLGRPITIVFCCKIFSPTKFKCPYL